MVENARRLGLTWRLRLGTVTESTSANSMLVRMDGDDESISVVSMFGAALVNSRVYVITIPPAGNFAVGRVVSTPSLRVVSHMQTAVSNSSSTSYANLTNIAGVAFTAPESGIVTILFTASMVNNTATGGSALTPWIGEGSTVGSGTEVVAASDNNALAFIQHATINENLRYGGHYIAEGLTPGTVYNVSMRGRSITAGTASFDNIATAVIPSP